jgi:hypothetical protein
MMEVSLGSEIVVQATEQPEPSPSLEPVAERTYTDAELEESQTM